MEPACSGGQRDGAGATKGGFVDGTASNTSFKASLSSSLAIIISTCSKLPLSRETKFIKACSTLFRDSGGEFCFSIFRYRDKKDVCTRNTSLKGELYAVIQAICIYSSSNPSNNNRSL